MRLAKTVLLRRKCGMGFERSWCNLEKFHLCESLERLFQELFCSRWCLCLVWQFINLIFHKSWFSYLFIAMIGKIHINVTLKWILKYSKTNLSYKKHGVQSSMDFIRWSFLFYTFNTTILFLRGWHRCLQRQPMVLGVRFINSHSAFSKDIENVCSHWL